MCINEYRVEVSDYGEKHYLFKKYSKKKNNKEIFLKAKKSLFLILEKLDLAIEKEIVKKIASNNNKNIHICKMVKWKILPSETGKGQNRCILVQDKEKKEVIILLAYDKNDCSEKETVWVKKESDKKFSRI